MLTGVAIAGVSGHYDIKIEGDRIASLVPSQAVGGGLVTPLLRMSTSISTRRSQSSALQKTAAPEWIACSTP